MTWTLWSLLDFWWTVRNELRHLVAAETFNVCNSGQPVPSRSSTALHTIAGLSVCTHTSKILGVICGPTHDFEALVTDVLSPCTISFLKKIMMNSWIKKQLKWYVIMHRPSIVLWWIASPGWKLVPCLNLINNIVAGQTNRPAMKEVPDGHR